MAKEKISIWKKWVLIPFTLSGKLVTFLGTYMTNNSQPGKVKNFFPFYHVTMPYAFEECSLDSSFMEAPTRVFWSSPPTQNKEYIVWLNKVQGKRQKQWEDLDIFDVIQISKSGPRYNPSMILASILFWEGSTSTFQFPCGMLTPTLFDVEAIAGFNPIKETFTPTIETHQEFVFELCSFKNYIIDHHDKKIEEVFD